MASGLFANFLFTLMDHRTLRKHWRWMREVRPTLTLAAPVAAGMLSQILLGLADIRMVAPLGVVPLGACAFVNNIILLPLVFSIGLLTSISVLTANAYGAKNEQAVGETYRHGLQLAFLSGLGALGFALAIKSCLFIFGQPKEIIDAAGVYLILFAASFVPGMITHAGKLYGEALNHPWAPNVILLSGVALNIGLNWILIYGNWGAPAMGLEGAGWATLIARSATAITMVVYTTRLPSLRRYQPRRWLAPICRATLGRLWKLGWPSAMQHLVEVGAFVLAGLMMGWIGTQSLAAHQIAIQCAATSFMLTLGLAVAVCVRVGHAVGAGQLRRVRRIGGVGLALAAAFMGVVAALFILFNGNIAGWFVDEPELVALTASLLWIAAFFQIADGIQVVASNALRGMGDVRVPAVIALFCYWGAQIPFAALMGFHFKLGAPGIWWGLVAGLVLSAIWLTARFLRLSRRLEKPPPAPR